VCCKRDQVGRISGTTLSGSTPLFLLSSNPDKNIIMHVRGQQSHKMFKLLNVALVFGCNNVY